MDNLTFVKSAPFAKVDETRHVAYGIATEQVVDKDNERCMYADSKPAYMAWSKEAYDSTTAAGQIPSLGNVRVQHDVSQLGGKVVQIDYLDEKKRINVGAEPADDQIWDLLRRGVLTGYSHSGNYLYRHCEICNADIPGRGNFCPRCQTDVIVDYAIESLAEISFVDNPCLGTAHFLYVKADGSQELRKIGPRSPESVIDKAKIEAARAAASFAAASKRTPQAADGRFTPRASGPLYDCLAAAGYEHARTGSSTDGVDTTSTLSYTHSSGSTVTVRGEDSWEHDDGHGRKRSGSGVEALQAHLESCRAKAAGVRDIRDYLKASYSKDRAEASLAAQGFLIAERSETYDSWRFVVKRSAGAVMVPIPPDSEPGKKLAELRGKIDPAHLMAKGLENEPHVTLRYGFTGSTEDIQAYLEKQAPFSITFGGTSSFEATEHSDGAAVLIATAMSDELIRMNAELANIGVWREANFEYKPHATIAYLMPENIQNYVGFDDIAGMTFTADQVVISDAEDRGTTINLRQKEELVADTFTLTAIGDVKRVFGEAPDAFVQRAFKSRTVLPAFEAEQFRRAARGEDPKFTAEQKAAIDDFVASVKKAEKKTKRVAGEDLTADCFLIVLDPDDTSTWNLPVKFSTEEKTKSHVRNALSRFDQLKDVPQDVKDAAWKKLVALAKKHDIDVDEDTDKALAAYRLRKADIDLAKSMYDVSDLAQLLQAIKWIEMRQIFEGGYEDDEDNLTIAGRLRAWLADEIDILKTMVDEETAEMLAEPALKAALLNKGAESMKKFNELLKGVQGFTGHFKAASAHHEMKAAHHMKCSAAHGEACEAHKAMGAEHHKMAAHHAADKVMAEHHKAMADHHMKMSAHHEMKAAHHGSMHKAHQSMCENCKAMCNHLEGNEKAFKAAVAEEPDTPQASEAMTKAIDGFSATMTRMEELMKANTPEALETVVTKAVDGAIAKLPKETPKLTVVSRGGTEKAYAAPPVEGEGGFPDPFAKAAV